MYTLRSFLWALRCCYTLRHGKLERVHLQREDLQRLTCHHSRVCRGSAEGLQRVCGGSAEPPCRGLQSPPLHAAEGTLCTLQSPPCALQRVPSARAAEPPLQRAEGTSAARARSWRSFSRSAPHVMEEGGAGGRKRQKGDGASTASPAARAAAADVLMAFSRSSFAGSENDSPLTKDT